MIEVPPYPSDRIRNSWGGVANGFNKGRGATELITRDVASKLIRQALVPTQTICQFEFQGPRYNPKIDQAFDSNRKANQ
jgi:hypothetical protein